MGEHVCAYAGDDIGPDIEFTAGGKHCSGRREAQTHLHFNFRSDGDTCAIVGDDPELVSSQKIGVDQVNVLTKQALLCKALHGLRPWSMLGASDVDEARRPSSRANRISASAVPGAKSVPRIASAIVTNASLEAKRSLRIRLASAGCGSLVPKRVIGVPYANIARIPDS